MTTQVEELWHDEEVQKEVRRLNGSLQGEFVTVCVNCGNKFFALSCRDKCSTCGAQNCE